MEVSSQSPVRNVYGRMTRLADAINDADSSVGQRRHWTAEYIELAGELAGTVGVRTAGGAELLHRATRRVEPPDGHTPRVPPRAAGGTDLYL